MSVGKTLIITLVSTLASITSALNSPCPDLFNYDSTNQPGQWNGTLTLLSDGELHGVWIRLIFDRKLSELNIDNNFGEVITSNNQDYLIKNRNFLLKSSTPTSLKINVKYEGNEIPNLTGYRLNAKVVCSKNAPQQYFEGDLNDKAFLSSLKSDEKAFDYEPGRCAPPPSAASDNNTEAAAKGRWQAALHIRKDGGGGGERYVCGGALVSPRHLLTAAHCVTYLGTATPLPTGRLVVLLAGRRALVDRIVPFPAYRPSDLLADLAVVRLEAAVEDVAPVCLSGSGAAGEEGAVLLLVGNGKNGSEESRRVEVIAEEECRRRTPELANLHTDNVLCASYAEDSSMCVGDSGSAMISSRKGSKGVWELQALVTVGVHLQAKNTCDTSSSIFLLNIRNYRKWITSVLV